MNASQPPLPRRRRLWPWVLLAAICAPFLVVGVIAYSVLALDRSAALLRHEVLTALAVDSTTVVQVSAGRLVLEGVRGCLAVLDPEPLRDARHALAAVKSASVGVYELAPTAGPDRRGELLNRVDRFMGARGWTRVVGVVDGEDTVMIYLPREDEEPESICLAVVSGKDLVVVSAQVRPAAIRELIAHHAGGRLELTRHLRLANF